MYKGYVDDPREPRSLADDPRFLASLSELDRGLTGDEPFGSQNRASSVTGTRPSGATGQPRPIHPPPVGPPPAQRGPRRMPLPPSIVSPFDAMALNDPHAQPERRFDLPDKPAALRPLIDLFPPEAPHEEADPAAPAKPRIGPAVVHPSQIPAPSATGAATYENFYGFTEKPFALSTDPHFFFHSTLHDAVAQQLLTAVRRREGLVVLTGDIGTGKTTLCRTVVEQLDRRTLTSFVSDPFVTGEDLLKTILVDFGVASRAELARGDATSHELSTTLLSFVDSLSQLEASAIVIIDEAQNLPPDVIEQIRILAEAGEASSLLQVVLVGQPALTTLLRRREYASLQQRVTVRATLMPLPPDEIDGYIMYRLAVAGSSPRVHFNQPALERIYRLSRGVPRVINLICDRALARGFEASASVIDAALIDAAAEDLDLGEPRSGVRNIASNALAIVALAVCMLFGAGLAAWVFHDAFARALALWRY